MRLPAGPPPPPPALTGPLGTTALDSEVVADGDGGTLGEVDGETLGEVEGETLGDGDGETLGDGDGDGDVQGLTQKTLCFVAPPVVVTVSLTWKPWIGWGLMSSRLKSFSENVNAASGSFGPPPAESVLMVTRPESSST